jgi:hypothetical protein
VAEVVGPGSAVVTAGASMGKAHAQNWPASYASAELERLLAVGGSSVFEGGEIEDYASILEQELEDMFRLNHLPQGDRGPRLLPLRLRWLVELVGQGDARRAAFQAFWAGMYWERVQAAFTSDATRLRRWRKQWANRKGKGIAPAMVQEAVLRQLEARPAARLSEVRQKVARQLGISVRTVRRYGPASQRGPRSRPKQGSGRRFNHE